MMQHRNNFKAGVFILLSVALIVGVILSIKGIERIFTPEQRRAVSFRLSDDLGGLQVGDEVRLGGFKVGVVKDIQVRKDVPEVGAAASVAAKPATAPASRPAPAAATATTVKAAAADDPTRLVVTFTLPDSYTLSDDAVVGVQTTVTGTACLNISHLGSGGAGNTELALVGKPSSLNALLANLGEIAPEVKPMVADARAAVGDVRQRVVPSLGDALVTYNDAGGHLRDMLGDTKTDFRGTVANLKDATGTIKEKLPATMDAAKQFIARLDTTVTSTESTLEDLRMSMANFRQLSAHAREVVGGNRGKIDTMIASLKTTGDNLKAASVEIRHSPWRLLYKPGKGEMANLNLYDSARQFADGAGSLNDAALALRDALAGKEAKPEEVKELLHKLDTSFANFRQVEDKLWTLVQD